MVAWQQIKAVNHLLFSHQPFDIPLTRAFTMSIDSRKMGPQQAFVAIKGEKFDGFDFLPEVLAAGCPLVIYDHRPERQHIIASLLAQYPQRIFLGVDHSVRYLQQISANHLAWWRRSGKNNEHKKIITLTGSNGKTTCKEMLSHLAAACLGPEKICATEGNLNNHLGLPLTLCRLGQEHAVAILEIGTNHPGEIQILCDLIGPTSGMITNIGASHLEFFRDREGVYWEKRSLFDAINGSWAPYSPQIFLINSDDDYLSQLPKLPFCRAIGTGPTNDYQIRPQFDRLIIAPATIIRNPHLIGEHNFTNLAMAWALIWEVMGQQEHFRQPMLAAAASFRPMNNRSKLVGNAQTGLSFVDAYNANPSSMQKSLAAFAAWRSAEQVAWEEVLMVLGDMNELGPESAHHHQQLGAYLQQLGAKNAIFIGRYAEDWGKTFLGHFQCYATVAALAPHWPSLRQQYKHFFFKASRSLQLESIIGIS